MGTGTTQGQHRDDTVLKWLSCYQLTKYQKYLLVCRQHNNYLREIVDKVEGFHDNKQDSKVWDVDGLKSIGCLEHKHLQMYIIYIGRD